MLEWLVEINVSCELHSVHTLFFTTYLKEQKITTNMTLTSEIYSREENKKSLSRLSVVFSFRSTTIVGWYLLGTMFEYQKDITHNIELTPFMSVSSAFSPLLQVNPSERYAVDTQKIMKISHLPSP